MHTHNGMLLKHKINEIFTFATTWMVLEGIMQKEINQSEQKTNTI